MIKWINHNKVSLSIFDIENNFVNINNTQIYQMIEENKNYLLKAIMGQYEYKIYVQLFS